MADADYTARHATLLSAIAFVGVSAWVGWCLTLGLPTHPWLSLPIAILVLAIAFFFAGLDPLGRRLIVSLRGTWSVFVLICVGLAAAFSPVGESFPLWALMPLLVCGVAIVAVILFFGLRSILRIILRRARLDPTLPPGKQQDA